MNAITPFAAPSMMEAEQGVLGSLLINNELVSVVSPYLRADHFEEPVHRAIYTAILQRVLQGRPANALTLAQDVPPINGGAITAVSYLAKLTAEAWTVSAHIEGTAREVALAGAKRSLSRIGGDLAAAATTPGLQAVDIVTDTEMELITISDDLAAMYSSGKAIEDYDAVVTQAEERMRSGRWLRGISTGLRGLDEKIGGFAPGDFVVLGGRPSMGKTALGVAIGRMAARSGAGVAFVSIEMPEAQVRQRLLSDESEAIGTPIAYQHIARGRIQPAHLDVLHKASEKLKRLPLVIIDRGNRLSDLPGHIRRARRLLKPYGKDLDLLIIDYLGLLRPGDRYRGQRVNEVGEISVMVKSLAKSEGLAIIGLHQLNRQNTQREDRRPRMDDLRDSGSLEQDADVVMFVHREAYYIQRPGYIRFPSEAEKTEALIACQREMEVIVAKQRQGPVGTVKLYFDETTNTVRDLA